MNIEWIFLFIALGALVGFLAGLLGAGGGGILVPILATIFAHLGTSINLSVHLAIGTALACMIVSSIASSRAHNSRGNIEWKIVISMAPGIICGALLISRFATHVHSTVISLCFSLMMALIAWQYFVDWQPKASSKSSSMAEMMCVGLCIGGISALVAAGSGFLTIIYLGYRSVDIKRAVGTSAAIGLPIAVAGTIGYALGGWSETANYPYTLGFIYVPAFFAISIASYIAAPIGARLALRFSAGNLKKVFAVFALGMSIKMFISTM